MRIGVYRPNGIGDTLLIAPTLQAIRRCYPEAHVHLWGNADAAYVLMLMGLCDSVDDHHKGLRLREKPTVFVGFDWDESGLAHMAQAFDLFPAAIGSFIAPRGVHQAAHCLSVAAAALPLLARHVWSLADNYSLTPPARGVDADWTDAVLIHLGTTMAEKKWPIDRYYALAERLSQRGYKVAFVESPQDNYGELAEAPVLTRSLAGQAYLAGRAALWIGNDTGPTHLAAMLGCPTLALFGASNPVIWRPLGSRAQTLLTCTRMQRQKEHVWCRNHDCFRDMTVDLVQNAAIAMLERRRNRLADANDQPFTVA